MTKGGLRLDLKSDALNGGDSGAVIVAGQSSRSELFERISSRGDDKMPPEGEPLTSRQIELVRRWIDAGALWPDGVDSTRSVDKYDWWSLRTLVRPDVPFSGLPQTAEGRTPAAIPTSVNPVDAFILAKLQGLGLTHSPEADRRTLIRRLSFDLIGLPPSLDEVEEFIADTRPRAYERLVDRLLESPHYGERWARHWLDVVHYGDTHGYDKDKPRPNAWPYRDYVIRAFNTDKPYSQFIEEQIAGDVLSPGTEDGITATGFIAAGPWDFIGHAEVPESKTDGMIARLLDRDDMVSNACNTFLSLTVQCARCHNHKFDPVVQDDYYRLQAVFAALDRADRSYDLDPDVASQRAAMIARQKSCKERTNQLDARVAESGGEALKKLDAAITAASVPDVHPLAAQFGYHSQIEPVADRVKWVQLDLGKTQSIDSVQLVGCHDDFNNIGAGFGFPVRFKIEMCDQDDFQCDVKTVVDCTDADFANPRVKPLTFAVKDLSGRYVRVTATKLAPRMDDYIFALAEFSLFDKSGKLPVRNLRVQSADSIESPPRWSTANLVDGYYFGVSSTTAGTLVELRQQRDELLATVVDANTRAAMLDTARELGEVTEGLATLPPPNLVYAGMVHSGSGAFAGTGATGGKPRAIHVLARGDVNKPVNRVGPGTVPLRLGESGEFLLHDDHIEGDRRVALAKWISSRDNPLTWRSIVNRVWQYHFGRGIADSPNDLGRMGQVPSHPELLDWLAVEFRDGGQSLKQLHRLLVTSATYRQSSNSGPTANGIETMTRQQHTSTSGTDSDLGHKDIKTIDGSNVYLWRMNRRKLDAESVRDAVLIVAGKLNRQPGGPAFQDFVVEKPEHSPHYEYRLHDPDDERIHRRSIYRFLVRSQPQPFMSTLDCADPSMSVDKRSETITSLQALALLNNGLMLTMARHMAARVEKLSHSVPDQVVDAFRLALSRLPTPEEHRELTAYAEAHGITSLCRVLINLNEFVFVD